MATDEAALVPPRAARWRRWGIRQQLTFAAAVAVTVPYLLGVLVLATLLHQSLTESAERSVAEENHRLTALVSSAGPSIVEAPDSVDDGFRAQVVDAVSGTVVATWNPTFASPLSALRPAPGQTESEGASRLWVPGEMNEGGDLVVASGVSHQGRSLVVLVSASQQELHEAVGTVVKILLMALPLLLLLTALAARALIVRALAPVDDITDRVRRITGRNLADRVPVPPSDDEIGTLAVTMNGMLARLEAARNAQSRFISDASHELRSPLTTLSGALEVGRSAGDERTWSELAPLMWAETARLQQLVGDLLLLSRTDDRGLRLSPAEVDLDDIVDAEVRRMRETTPVQVRRTVQAARIVGDRDKLLAALRNLDDNALRHAHSVVHITLKPGADGGARLTVEDDGAGVPEAERQRIFERFVRLDESRSRDSGGSGLGLAIVTEVVRAHGGTVRVEESALGGASFVVELPAAPPAGRPGVRPASGASRETPAADAGADRRANGAGGVDPGGAARASGTAPSGPLDGEGTSAAHPPSSARR